MRMPPTSSTSTARDARRWSSEQGSILVPTAVALLGLLAFSAFTIDNGIMLSSRRQAQNAADSGALAAALYLTWDDINDQAGAQAAGVAAAQLHQVWDAAPDVTLADVTFPSCPPGAPGLADVCVRVDVFRNTRANGNPLPAFFANLAGVSQQGVRATATAQVLFGRAATNCILPFAIPDRWREYRESIATQPPPTPITGDAVDDPALSFIPLREDSREDLLQHPYDTTWFTRWDPNDTYDAYVMVGQHGGAPLTPPVDSFPSAFHPLSGEEVWSWNPEYVPMTTGYSSSVDHGLKLTLKKENGTQIAPSFYYPILLNDGLGTGAADYMTRITSCTGATLEVGDYMPVEPGAMIGPTRMAVNALVATDPGDIWDETLPRPDACVGSGCGVGGGNQTIITGRTGGITGGCQNDGVPDSCLGFYPNRSPRLKFAAVFDADNYMSGARTGRGDIYITEFVGMFMIGMNGDDVEAYITDLDLEPGAAYTADTSSALRTVVLVR